MKGTRIICHTSAVLSAVTSVDFVFILYGCDYVLKL